MSCTVTGGKKLPSPNSRGQNERCGGEDPHCSAEPPVAGLPARFGKTLLHLQTGPPHQRHHRPLVQTCESVRHETGELETGVKHTGEVAAV